MSDLLTVLLALIALWGVGGALALAVLPQTLQRWWFVVGLSPLLTLGVAFSVSSLASVAHIDVTAPITALVVVGSAVIGVVVRRRSICWRCLRPTRSEVLEVMALAAIAGLTFYALWHSRGSALLLPNYDAQNHAFLVRRILEEATLDPSRIVVQNPVTDLALAEYYPLSLHLFTGFVVRFGTLSIPTALFGLTSIVVAVAWPMGMYALTKVAVPWRWAPVTAAAFASTALQFPYKPISWGGLTTMVGLSLVPIVVAIMLVALRDIDTSAVPAIGLALGALFTLHNSQVFAAAILAVSIGAPFVFRRDALRFLSARVVVAFVVMFLVPTITTLPDLAGGVQERSGFFASYYDEIAGLVGQMVTLSMNSERSTILPLLFVLFGTAVAFATRSGRSVVLAYFVFATLVAVAGLDQWWTAPLHRLVAPWYGQYERVAYNLVIPVSILGAIAVCGGWQLLADRISGMRAEGGRRLLAAGLTVTVVAAVAATTVGSARNLNAAATKDFAYFQMLDISIVEEAQRLAVEQGRPIRILASNGSGALWLYVLDPRLEVLGSFLTVGDLGVELDELIGRLPQANADPWVDERLARYRVDLVFTNGSGFNSAPSAPLETDLDANPCFEVVAQVGDDRLWSVCGSA